jgi:histidine phosphotransferase ChpT
MAQSSDTIRLVELICARLCHDLGGLIGTVANALDMVTEDAGRDNEVLAFASSAAHALTQRLRLMRTAWGPESDAITLPALVLLVSQALAARRVRLDIDRLQADCEFASPVARVVLNLIAIVLLGEPADLLVRIVGPGAAWPQGFTECMRDESAALAALTNALSVQMPLTALFAQSGGLRLSPVLGPASGIEALRLSPG